MSDTVDQVFRPTEEHLRAMKLHDSYRISKTAYIVKVIGGWIYNIKDSKIKQMNTIFIPDDAGTIINEEV